MSIASTLESFLNEQSINYVLVQHSHTGSSMDTAQAAHIPGGHLAKGVAVNHEGRFLLVVVPSDYHVDLGRLQAHLGGTVAMATESQLTELFPDCDQGAAPPIGAAYGLRTLLDRSLKGCAEVYFESGDHEHLVKVSGDQFALLMQGAEEVDIGKHI